MGSTGLPIIGQNIYYASQIGCVLDCDPVTGLTAAGGAPTDNTAALNAILATATHTHPVRLILDGGSACTGLVIPVGGHVTIEGNGRDSGLFLLAASNTSLITNWTSSSQAASANIEIRNLYLNGNFPNNGAVGFFAPGIFIFNASHVRLENLTLMNVTYFNVLMNTVTDFQGVGCNISGTHLNADGFHISGNCSNIKISRNTISTYDDGVALNAPENQGSVSGGPISDVEVSDNVYSGALSMVRMYSSSTGAATVSRVMISNNSGTFTGQAWASGCVFFLGNGDTYADGIQTVTASNITASLTDSSGHFVKINDSCGTVKVTGTWDSPIAANAFVLMQTVAAKVSDLTLENCTIYRSTRGSSAAYGVQSTYSGCVISRLRLAGFNVVNQASESYSAIPYLIDMADLTITELVIDALDTTNITALVNPTTGFTGIGTISGAGILNTGFEIPDSIMANNCPYISATSYPGHMCIKLGGTVTQIV